MKPDPSEPRSNPTSVTPRDDDLVARARDRDTEAFRGLVERHRDRAYALALRMLRSPADAEEVAQDAFVRAWVALPRFRGESSFGTWLHRIVARRAIDRAAVLKTRRNRETVIDAADYVAASVEGGPTGDALALERLMGALSDAQRATVTLFYYEGRSVDQVASILGLPAGTVKTHLSRARAVLRSAWRRNNP